ncbi:hypothetical protein [uncultured Sphingobacterium sp.]|uniref:hypothetical protein n=1 Tax=uncultured Sphingobacterium sp. TaxID=182688 RepID=UPI0025D859FF|nr:hypothetical protein [uncultured Sphingobacterium sp.]
MDSLKKELKADNKTFILKISIQSINFRPILEYSILNIASDDEITDALNLSADGKYFYAKGESQLIEINQTFS